MAELSIPKEIDDRLDAIAKATGRSKRDHALDALIEYIGDREDAEIAERRLADLREGRSSTTSLEEIMRRYGMAD